MSSTEPFTVIGLTPDGEFRWAEHVSATSPKAAEGMAPEGYIIAGVIRGWHNLADAENLGGA